MRFPAKKNAGCPKAPRDFPPRKDGILYPRVGLSWDSPPPPAESVRTDGRTYVRTYVRTDGHVTITSQPKFLGSIGYQICLAMELRWRALPASSAIILIFPASSREDNTFYRQLLGSVAQKIQNSAKNVCQIMVALGRFILWTMSCRNKLFRDKIRESQKVWGLCLYIINAQSQRENSVTPRSPLRRFNWGFWRGSIVF